MAGPREKNAPSTDRAGVLAMLGATLLWGGTFVVIRDSVRALDPVTLVFIRFAAAGILLGTITAWLRPRFDRAAWVGGALGGLCAAAGYLCQAIGLQSTTAGTSAFLTCMGTLFAALFAWPLLAQRPSGVLLAGIALALAGSALLPSGGVLRLGAGEIWTLLGAIAYALQIVVLARYAPRAAPVAIAFVQTAVLVLALAPFVRTPVHALMELQHEDLIRLAYLAVAGSAIAPFLHILAQRTLPAGRIGLLFALEPVFALGFAVTMGGERFAGAWWFGAALILAGVAGVEFVEFRRSSRA